MTLLLVGLLLFFGMHSIAIVALPLRDRLAAKSDIGWKILFGLISLVGIVLISKGYAELRQSPTVLYVLPAWSRHIAALLLLPAFVLFLAPYFPGRIKSTFAQPQLIAVKAWAIAHLLVNGTVADSLLFGSFLVWAVADMLSMKNRVSRPLMGAPESAVNDIILIIAGLGLYAVFVFWAHEILIGVRPFAM
jgi:uncharacterized membrane protein